MTRLTIATIAIMLCLAGSASAQQEQVLYYHTDALGSVRMITDATGQVIERHDYLPFGQEYLPPQSTERRLFGGLERDTDTQFDYAGARYYADVNGRFTTVDPGHVAGDIFNPQTWNGYSYALNNPLRFIDPFGFESCPPPTNTSTCTEAKGGSGQVPLDFLLAYYLIGYEVVTYQTPDVAAAPLFVPPVLQGEGALTEALALGRISRVERAAETATRGTSVLGHFPTYLEKANELGARRFNIPPGIWAKMSTAARWAANQKFLDRLIMRGDEVVLTTPVGRATAGSSFEREIEYLLGRGYQAVDGGWRLIPGAK